MDYFLNSKQLEILARLKDMSGSDRDLDLFLSTPNKEFRNKTPIDMLRQEEYQYFEKILSKVK